TFATGTSLWRVDTDHFSPLDLNYPILLDGVRPEFDVRRKHGCSAQESFSIIECENQILGQEVPIVGTPITLAYRSSRTPGWLDGYSIDIPLTGDSIPELLGVELTVRVAGRTFIETFGTAPNQVYT